MTWADAVVEVTGENPWRAIVAGSTLILPAPIDIFMVGPLGVTFQLGNHSIYHLRSLDGLEVENVDFWVLEELKRL